MNAPLPVNEAQRLATLRQYEVLDTPPEQAFDDLTLLAAHICQVPTAMVSLVDEHRQWFKSRIGMTATETTRDIAFCAHTILHADQVLEVRDAEADPRFAGSPLVTSDPHIRFYAGAPLVTPDGQALGALCVMDRKPRTLTPEQLAALRALSRHVVSQLELRRQSREAAGLLTVAEKSRRALLSVLEDEKRAGLNLRESEERFRQLAENINEVFWITDPVNKAVLYISPAYETVWGRTCDSLYQAPGNWVEAIHPDDRNLVLKGVMDRQARGTYDETYRIVRPDGSMRWVRDRAYPIRNPEGQVYRIVGTAEDISSQKEMEVQVMRMQRMESVGRMASGIAHDLNNILAPILMGAPLLRMGLSPGQVEKTLAAIETSARRGADLVKQLLMFGRGVEGRRVLIRLKDLVREMEKITEQTFPRNIAIVTEVPADIRPVMGDVTQLHQVLLNLCVNARDAMPQGGTLTITAENFRIDESYASMSPEARPGDYVCMTVTDTGTGIPPSVLEKIFEPFYTTKEVGKGTGLGLSTLIGIVKSHAGFVTVRSEVGQGSSFHVYLPSEAEAREDPPEVDAAAAPRGHGETVLIVDDEAGIRQISTKILEQYGYRVLASGDGADACAQFARHLAEIEIVLTDIDMPVMGGGEMIRVLKKMKPTIKVIISSGKAFGHGGQASRTGFEDLQANSVLTKPYTADRLLHVIHALITNAPGQDCPKDTPGPFPA
jgi:PAS domain S-box-containing protein